MKEIKSATALKALLCEIEKDTEYKTSISNGKLKDDFGNVYYFTNNKTRANRLNNILVSEVAQSKTKTIIPPTIIPYTIGFVQLASLAKFGSINTLNICEYSDDWFGMFIYYLTTKTIQDSFFKDSYGETENKRANLSKDFRNFIRDVTLNLKEEKLDALIKEEKFTDDVSKMFFDTYLEYKKVENEYKYSKTKFIHSLSAYKYLYEAVTKKQDINPVNKVIIVENPEMLEPIFQEILKNIDCPVYVIKDEKPDEENYKKTTEIYNFMTPLDESEFVGWKIKDLMQQGIPGIDISVCCANNSVKEVLETVFDRFKISGEKQTKLIENKYYRLVKILFNIIYKQDNIYINLQDIFYDIKSKFMLEHGFFKLNNMFIEKGVTSKINKVESLIKTVHEFIEQNKQDKTYEKTIEILNSFLELAQNKNLKITEIANKVINDKKDKQIINDIMIALFELDTILAGQTGERYVKNALALFSILDEREINSTRDKMFLDGDTEYQKEDTYNIEIAKIEQLKTSKSKYLFICGLNASFDKNIQLSYPLKIAKELGLETIEDKKLLIAKSIISAINTSKQNIISYPYLTMECKEDGKSSLIKTLINLLPKEKNILGENGRLLTSTNVIKLQGDKKPDKTFLTDNKNTTTKEMQLINFKDELFKDMTLDSLLKQVLFADENGKYRIGVKDFVKFIQCQRQFVFSMIAKKCNIETADVDGIINMQNGSFKHKIFELAAQQKDFCSQDVEKVKKVLQDSAEQVINTTDISKFFLGSKETLFEELKNKEIPLFALNEVERQKQNKTAVEAIEKKFSYNIEGTDFCLSCKFDRIDKSSDNKIFIWDYKTGNPKKDAIKFTKQKKVTKNIVFENNANSLQLALYMYIYAKETKESFAGLCGANIYINGKDNLDKHCYDQNVEDVINRTLELFKIELNNNIDYLPLTNPSICDGNSKLCDYCSFKYACNIID
ncbi:MAG: PD-(D/E)XK nuclease family protein [Endomicrobiaceae bacterium]|nr:PD-(D/E)XK nuclease family protein [Endomicrobiaceae bacterium]